MNKATKIVAIALIVATIVAIVYIAAVLEEKKKPISPALHFRAIKLATKPEKYINLTEPDQYVKEAIANLGKLVCVYNAIYWGNSTLPDLINEYHTNNVKVEDEFYKIELWFAEELPSSLEMFDFLPLMFICFAWVFFAICLKGKSLIAPEKQSQEKVPRRHP